MARRKTPARYKSGPKKGQFKPKSATRRRTRSNPPKRRTRRASSTRSRATTTRRRRRTTRRNPAMLKSIQKGVKGSAFVLGGEAATNALDNFLPSFGGIPRVAIQAGAALVVGVAAEQFLKRADAELVMAGALAVPIRAALKGFNVPMLSSSLAGYSSSGLRGYSVRGAARAQPLAGYSAPPAQLAASQLAFA